MYKKETVRKRPELLGRIIDAVNYLPANADEILEKIAELAKGVKNSDLDNFHTFEDVWISWDSYRAELKNLKLEGEVLGYLIGEEPSLIRMGLADQKLLELMLAKPILQSIAKINRDEIKKYGKKAFTERQENPLIRIRAYTRKMQSVRFTGTLELEGEFIRPGISGLPLVFEKEHVPPERIRECLACQSIFWAKRIDSPTCSKRCLNTFNTRNTRVRKLEKELKKLQTNSNTSSAAMRLKEEKIIKLQRGINQRKIKYGTI